MSRLSLNSEGLTFEEWVCAATLAVIDGHTGLVRPYTESETYMAQYYLGTAGTSDERFFDMVPRFRKRTQKYCFYSKRIRDAWKAGEDPTDWRAAKEKGLIDASGKDRANSRRTGRSPKAD